jgi:hypothetical protein
MNKKIIIIVSVATLVIGGIAAFFIIKGKKGKGKGSVASQDTENEDANPATNSTASTISPAALLTTVKDIRVQYRKSKDEIRKKYNDAISSARKKFNGQEQRKAVDKLQLAEKNDKKLLKENRNKELNAIRTSKKLTPQELAAIEAAKAEE